MVSESSPPSPVRSDEELETAARAIYGVVAFKDTQSPEHFTEFRDTWIAAAHAAFDPLLVRVGQLTDALRNSERARSVMQATYDASLGQLTAERDAALADAANLTEFGIDLAVYEGVEAQRDEADRQLGAMTTERDNLQASNVALQDLAHKHMLERDEARAALQRVQAELALWDEAVEPDGSTSLISVRGAAALIRAALGEPLPDQEHRERV